MGGLRELKGWNNYDADTYYKDIPDIEARISLVTVDSVTWTEQIGPVSPGQPIPPIAVNKWYLDTNQKRFYINVGAGQDANDKTILIKTFFLLYGEYATQAEMVNNELFQIFHPTINVSLKYLKVPLFLYGNPMISSIYFELQSLRNGIPSGKVLARSDDAFPNIDWQSTANRLIYMWFKFGEYGMRANTDYALVLKAFGNINNSNHIAWGKLDLVYRTGLPTDLNAITEGGQQYAIIGTKL